MKCTARFDKGPFGVRDFHDKGSEVCGGDITIVATSDCEGQYLSATCSNDCPSPEFAGKDEMNDMQLLATLFTAYIEQK